MAMVAMIAAALMMLAATAAAPAEERFDLLCSGSRVEALGTQAAPPEPWTGRLSVDLGRGVVHRDDEQENLRLQPGPPGRLVIQDEVKGFGDAVTRAEAHLDRATGAYAAQSSVEVGGALLSQTTISAVCKAAPFTALAPKDAPEPVPEAEPGRPTPR